MLLSELQHIRSKDGAVVVLARHHGKYSRPVQAHELDMRLEDNPEIPRVMLRIDATWVAKHPTEDYYIVYDGVHGTCDTRVPSSQMPEWAARWRSDRKQWQPRPTRAGVKPTPPPDDIYRLPERGDAAWWEWVQAFDNGRRMVKAPKKPRPGEMTPEDVDERGGEEPDLKTRLDRIYTSE